MMIAAHGWTYPEAGVMQARPATAPLAPPITVALPVLNRSIASHAKHAAEAPTCVLTNALEASPPAVMALPALKPNQPNQSMLAPRTTIGMLCGTMSLPGYPRRGPK